MRDFDQTTKQYKKRDEEAIRNDGKRKIVTWRVV